jgi:uroporphyrinogen decarboxylase
MKHEKSLFIRSCKGEKTERPPIWLMRQAGRYLPEYMQIRHKHSMLEVIRNPELAVEVTMQPIRRFGFDASIVFTDILTPLIGMGFVLEFIEKEGPVIFNPVSCAKDVQNLKTPTSEQNVPFTLQAITELAKQLPVPLIGFSGAPFTLSSYAVKRPESGSLRGLLKLMREEPATWDLLQTKLSTVVTEYLIAQAHAGASALMLFDSWVGVLPPIEFVTHVQPYLTKIINDVRAACPSVPLIYFGPNTNGLLSHIGELGTDVVGLDWRVSLHEGLHRLKRLCTIQGNLDPELLTVEWECAERHVKRILEESRNLSTPHIFNLGHGILPDTPVANVERLVAMVQGQ